MDRTQEILRRIKQTPEEFARAQGLDETSLQQERTKLIQELENIPEPKEGENEVFNALRANPDYYIGDTPSFAADLDKVNILKENVIVRRPDGSQFETTVGAAFYDIQQNISNTILVPTLDGAFKEINVRDFQNSNFQKAKELLKDTILQDKIYNPFSLENGLYVSNKNFSSIEEVTEIPLVNAIIGTQEEWDDFIETTNIETLKRLGLSIGSFLSGLVTKPENIEEFGININQPKQKWEETEQLKKDLLDYKEDNLIKTNISLYAKNSQEEFGFFNPYSFLEKLKEDYQNTKQLENKRKIQDFFYKEGNRIFFKEPSTFAENWQNVSNKIDESFQSSPLGAIGQAIDALANTLSKENTEIKSEFLTLREKRIQGYETGKSFAKDLLNYVSNLPARVALIGGNLGSLIANSLALEAIQGMEYLKAFKILPLEKNPQQLKQLQENINIAASNLSQGLTADTGELTEKSGKLILPENIKFNIGQQEAEITGKDIANFTAGLANTLPLIASGVLAEEKVTKALLNSAKNANKLAEITAKTVGSLAGSSVTGTISALQNLENTQTPTEFLEQIGKEVTLDFLMFTSSTAINQTISRNFGNLLGSLEKIKEKNSLVKFNQTASDFFANSELVDALKQRINDNTFRGLAGRLSFLDKIENKPLLNIGYNLASGLVKTSTFLLSSQLSTFAFETLVNSIYNNQPTLGGNILIDWNKPEKRAARINEIANQIGFGLVFALAPSLFRNNKKYRQELIEEINRIGTVSIESNWEDVKDFINKNIPSFTYNKDAFSKLNLEPGASIEEIKERYRQLANIYHPDKPNGDTQKFIEIKNAYESLTQGQEVSIPENIRTFINLDGQRIDISKSYKQNLFQQIEDDLKKQGIDTNKISGKVRITTTNPANFKGLTAYEIARRIGDIDADGRIFELSFDLLTENGLKKQSIIFGITTNADGSYRYTNEEKITSKSIDETIKEVQEQATKLIEIKAFWDKIKNAKKFVKIATTENNKKQIKTVLETAKGYYNLFGEKVLGSKIGKGNVSQFIFDWGRNILSAFKENYFGTISKKQIQALEREPFVFLDNFFKGSELAEVVSLKETAENKTTPDLGQQTALFLFGEKIAENLTEKEQEKLASGDNSVLFSILSNPILKADLVNITLPQENGQDFIQVNSADDLREGILNALNIYRNNKQNVYSEQLFKLSTKEEKTAEQGSNIPEDASTRTGLQQENALQSDVLSFKESKGGGQKIPNQRRTIETIIQNGKTRGKSIFTKISQNSFSTDGSTTNKQPKNTRGLDNWTDNTDSSRMGNTLIEKEIVDLVKGKDIDINSLYSIAKNYTRTSENVLLDNQYYTPLIITDLVWAIAKKYNYNSTKSVLENSAGTGRFLWGIENDNLFFYETNPFSAILAKLLSKGKWLYNQNFSFQEFKENVNNTLENPRSFSSNQEGTLKKILDFTSYKQEVGQKYDFIIGNPPYDNKILKEFILKSSELLKPGGYLIQILPLSYYKKYYEDIFSIFDNLNLEEVVALPIESFSVNFENLTNHRPAEVQTGIFVFSKKTKENRNVEIKKIGKETEKINRYKQKQTIYTLDIQGTKTKEKVAKEIEKAINNFIQENNLEKLDRKPLNEEEIQKNLEELRKTFSTQTTKTDLGVLPLSLGISNLAEVLYNQNIFVSSFLNSVVDFSIPFTSFSLLESVGKRIKRTGLFSWRLSGTIEKESYLNELETKRNQILEEIPPNVKKEIGTFTTLLSNPVKRGRILETVEKLQDIASNKEKLYGPFIKEAEKVRETENQIDAIFDEFDQKYQLKTQDGEEIATAKLLLSTLFLDAKGNLSNKGIVYNTFGAPIIARDKIVSQEFPVKELKKHNERGYYVIIHTGEKITEEQLAQKLTKITEKIEKIIVSKNKIKIDYDAIDTQKALEEMLFAENLNYRKSFSRKTKKVFYSVSKERVFVYTPKKLKTEDIPQKQFVKATLFSYDPLQAILDKNSYDLVTQILIPEINKIKNKNILYDSNNLAKTINKTIAKNGPIKASAIIRTKIYIYNLPVGEENLTLEQRKELFRETEGINTEYLRQIGTDKTVLQKFIALKENLSQDQIADFKAKNGISRILDIGRFFVVSMFNNYLDNKAISKLKHIYLEEKDIPQNERKDYTKITLKNIPESISNKPQLVLDFTLGKYTNPKIDGKRLDKERKTKVEYYIPLEIVNNNIELYSLSKDFSSSIVRYINKGINAFENQWFGQLTKTIFSSYLRTVFTTTETIAARFAVGINNGIQRYAPILITRLAQRKNKERMEKLKENKDLIYEISFDLSTAIENTPNLPKYRKYTKDGQNRIQKNLYRGLEVLSNVILNDELLDTKTKNSLVNKINKSLNLVLDTFRASQKIIDPSFVGVLIGDIVTKTNKIKFLGEYDSFVDPMVGFFVDWCEENRKELTLESYNEFRKTEEFIDIRDFVLRQNGFAKANKIENFYLKLTAYNANLRSVFFLFNQIREQKQLYNTLFNYRKILKEGTKRQKYIYTLALANYLLSTLAILFFINLLFYENEKRLKNLVTELTPGTKVFKETVKDLDRLFANKQNLVDMPGVIGGYLYLLLKSPFVSELVNILNLKDIEELSKNPTWLLSDAKINELDKEIISIIKREKNIGIVVKKETRDLKETILSLLPVYKLLQTIGEIFGFKETEKEKKEKIKRSFLQKIIGGITEEQKEKRIQRDRELAKERKTDVVTQKLLELNNIIAKSEFREETKEEKQKDIKRLERRFGKEKFEKAKENLGIKSNEEIGEKILIKRRGEGLRIIKKEPGEKTEKKEVKILKKPFRRLKVRKKR